MGRDFTGWKGESRVGLYEFLRDVLLASIDKSLFPFALAAIIVLAVIWKLSPGDLAHLLVGLSPLQSAQATRTLRAARELRRAAEHEHLREVLSLFRPPAFTHIRRLAR